MRQNTTADLINEIVNGLPTDFGGGLRARSRRLLKHQLAVLVRFAKAEQLSQLKQDVEKAAKLTGRADARRQSKTLLKRLKLGATQADLRFD